MLNYIITCILSAKTTGRSGEAENINGIVSDLTLAWARINYIPLSSCARLAFHHRCSLDILSKEGHSENS